MDKKNWHALSIKQVLMDLHSSTVGLSIIDVRKRLKKFGYNELPQGKELRVFDIFFRQYKNPMVLILVVASVISGLVGEYVDMSVIILALIINTVLGFIQEYKADKAISKLKTMLEYKAHVLRDGLQETIDPRELVPGDILILEAGDRVSADARIIWQKNFEINEAPLTGESLPIHKNTEKINAGISLADRLNMVYMGTTAIGGRCRAVVCQTGINTHFGEIAHLIDSTVDQKTPLQVQLVKFSRYLGGVLLLLSFAIFLVGIFQHRNVVDMLLVSVAVAVSAVPEGLLVSLTVILAIGMQKILKKNALIRKLIATETLGSVSVICSDKTGTITEGEMRIASIITAHKNFKHTILKTKNFAEQYKTLALALNIGTLCNDALVENLDKNFEKWKVSGNPTDKAMVLASIEAGIKIKELKLTYRLKDELPFSSENKFMAKLFKNPRGKDNILYIKGAPEKILAWSGYQEQSGTTRILNLAGRQQLARQYRELTKQGLRVIGVAYKIVEEDIIDIEKMSNLVFVAFIGLKDPLRQEAKEAIRLCQSAGIKPVIITGDHKLTAKAIVQELGIKINDSNIIEGKDLDKLSDNDFERVFKKIKVYARVQPRQKVRIVQAWKDADHTVAMIGDGINDAPAIKSADIGVAVGMGTDVAKQVADMVLLDNNYRTIVEAVRQGRVIFDNIRKNIVYLLADSFSEIILVMTSLLLGAPLPITAAQILWINLITDGFPSLALTVEPAEKDIMQQKPRSKHEPLLTKEMKIIIFIIGIFTDLVLIILFVYLWKQDFDFTYIRSIMFAALGIDSLLYVFSIKSLRRTLIKINPFSNKYLVVAVLVGWSLQLLAMYFPPLQRVLRLMPIGQSGWAIVLSLAFFKLFLIELTKFFFIVRSKRPVYAS